MILPPLKSLSKEEFTTDGHREPSAQRAPGTQRRFEEMQVLADASSLPLFSSVSHRWFSVAICGEFLFG